MSHTPFLTILLFSILTIAQSPTGELKPLAQAQIRQLVEAGVDNDRLAEYINERGIDFELSGDFLIALREKGALPAVLKALGTAGLKAGGTPLDKGLLQELVRAGMDSLGLAAAIEKRGIDFQPGRDFLQSLREAGAPEALLRALGEMAPKPLSREQVLSLLAGGVANERVAMLVRRRGLTFKADEQYLDSLGVAGADESVLLAVRQAKRPPAFVLLHQVAEHGRGIHPLTFSSDGRWLASVSGDLNVKLWSVADGSEGRTVGSHADLIRSIASSPDGRYLASAGYDEAIKVWETDSGGEARVWSGQKSDINVVAFSPDSKFLASGGQDGTVKLWDVGKDSPIRSFASDNCAVLAVAFSPDGKRLASGQSDKTIRLWDVLTGQRVADLIGHADAVHGVAFSPDGRYLASAGSDKTVRIWEAATGHAVRTVTGHSGPVWCVAFAHDGRYLVSGSADGSLRLWEVETGQEVTSLIDPGFGTVPTMAFSFDGKHFAAAHDDTLMVWRVED